MSKTMAEVLAEHQDCTAGQNLGYYRTLYTCECGETFMAGDHEEDPSYWQANAAHQAAALSAAGYGLVADAKREARAQALEDAADAWSDWDALEAPESWLRARAVAERGGADACD